MLKKSIIILVILAVINNINFAASSKQLDISPEKELLILNSILNRNREITTVQKEQFAKKLYSFLRDYEGSNKMFNLWKAVSGSGLAISDPLSQDQEKYNSVINDIVIGHRPIDIILKYTLKTILKSEDIFIIEPYLDILTKTNVNIDLVKLNQIASEHSYLLKQNYAFLALIYFFANQILSETYINAELNNGGYNDTLLTLVIRYKNLNLLKKLLKSPFLDINKITNKYTTDVDFANKKIWSGENPLNLAMNNNSIDIVAELLKHNALLYRGEYGYLLPYPLHSIELDSSIVLLWATEKLERALKILPILLREKKDFYENKCNDRKNISMALENLYNLNNIETMKLLIDEIPDKFYVSNIKRILLKAMSNINNEFNKNVIELLFSRFKIETIYPNALIDAVKKQDLPLVELLISNGFDQSIKDDLGHTAFYYEKFYDAKPKLKSTRNNCIVS